jgi:hypothetical protein
MKIKRSPTANTMDNNGNEVTRKLKKGNISKILSAVDIERKLNVTKQTHSKRVESSHGPENNDITDYRRKGVLKQRRLSRINLGKQLALSDTSGLRLQWTVDS